MSDEVNHYKARYLFYKDECLRMRSLLNRFQEILDGSEFPTILSQSPPPPENTTSRVAQQDRTSPILGLGSKARTFKKHLGDSAQQPKESDDFDDISSQQRTEKDAGFDGFQAGSNKWECIEEDDIHSYFEESPDHHKDENKAPDSPVKEPKPKRCSSPLERLKKIKKFSGLELQYNTSVSPKIHGITRRMLPGQTCDKCSDYMECAGLGKNFVNRASRHRSSHERPKTPPGFWSLDLSQQIEMTKKKHKKENNM